ncbi:MAG TPA: FAD-binding protein [bacterium]
MQRISRRDLLRLAARTGLATAVAGALPAWLESTARVEAAPSRQSWAALARRLRGRLLRPGDVTYAGYPSPFNLRYADVRPAGIVLCRDAPDVVEAVNFARTTGMPIAARAGGHSYGGYSTTRGLLVDLSRLKTVSVGSGVATFGAGALNGDVAAALPAYSAAIPSGRCPSVGLSGLLLGGGFGFSSRRFGLTCDSLLETQLVTADGRLRTCNAQEHSDLFWACQGGGGGNFGINVAYKLRTFPVGTVSIYKLVWTWEAAAAAFHQMQAVSFRAPDGFSMRLGAIVSPAAKYVVAIGQYFGPRAELLDLLKPALATRPGTQFVLERHYWDAYDFLKLNQARVALANRSSFLDAPLSDGAVATALSWLDRWPGGLEGSASMFGWGGAINRVAPDATAFVHRDKHFLFQMETLWNRGDPAALARANLEWIDGIYAALRPSFSRQAYQNFIDPALRDWPREYYGGNLARLQRIKRTYDSDNLFRSAQSIPPA